MRLADRRNDRARAQRTRAAALKRAVRLKVAREHAAGDHFRRRLASRIDHGIVKAPAAIRRREASRLLAGAGYAKIFKGNA